MQGKQNALELSLIPEFPSGTSALRKAFLLLYLSYFNIKMLIFMKMGTNI